MRRRDFLTVAALALPMTTRTARATARFHYLEASADALRRRMQAGRLSARALAAAYLRRIERIDRHGPRLNAVIETNPDALELAAELDRERKAGKMRGPLHGLPVLLKDNIATADRMQTSAGSLALVGAKAPRDAFVAARLRAAGAVVLGKTNLSEWANIRSPRSTSGWSARGGLTRNPYALDRSASGSSSGSAAAVAANLAWAALGTETDGSIVSPASICGIVGLKPTVGLVSRDGIVPISHTQDTAGPMARTVADAALLLAAIAGRDERDVATHAAPAPPDYTRALDARGLQGARLGVVRNAKSSHPGVNALFERQLEVLRANGAELVDVQLENLERIGAPELEVLLNEFKAGLEAYLAEFGRGSAVASLADVIAFNERERAREMPYFGQEFFELAQGKGGLDDPAYRAALAECRKLARTEGLDRAFADSGAAALIAPTGGLAWLIDLVNGDAYTGNFSTPAAVAGYPHLTVPMGFVSGLPAGLSFVGPAWSEETLLRFGYAFEQATRARRPPEFARTLKWRE